MKSVAAGILLLCCCLSVMGSDLQGLDSPGPWPEYAEKMMLFGQFVGNWQFDATFIYPDGSKRTGRGEWHFGWALEGRAIQDTWISPPRSERASIDPRKSGYGTTLRVYNPKIDAWDVLWIDPIHYDIQRFVARRAGNEIVMEETNPDGSLTRWIFSSIRPDSFEWRSVTSSNQGKTWTPEQTMSVRRVL